MYLFEQTRLPRHCIPFATPRDAAIPLSQVCNSEQPPPTVHH